MSNRFPSIPPVGTDLSSLIITVQALKEVVEGLAGLRAGGVPRAAAVTVNITPPGNAPGRPITVGDIWINANTNQLHFWNGTTWVAVL